MSDDVKRLAPGADPAAHQPGPWGDCPACGGESGPSACGTCAEYEDATVIEQYHGGLQALVRVAGERGKILVYVVAGVPEQYLAAARSAGDAQGLGYVWAAGDSLAAWCPEGMDPEEALERAHGPALNAWRASASPEDGGGAS